jgi:hypothetical protein
MVYRNVKLEAVLKDTGNNPVVDRTVTFKHKLSSEASWITDGSRSTGSDGKASLTITVDTPNHYDFRADFAGDDTYDASYDAKTGIYIQPPPPSALLPLSSIGVLLGTNIWSVPQGRWIRPDGTRCGKIGETMGLYVWSQSLRKWLKGGA